MNASPAQCCCVTAVLLRDGEEVVGALRARPVGVADVVAGEHVRPLHDGHVEVREHHDRARHRRLELPVREREDEMGERPVHEEAEGGADRVDRGAVRLRQRAQEPEEADDRHQHADPVLRPADGRDQAAADEYQAEADDQSGARGGVVLVVTGENERKRRRGCRQRDRPRRDQEALGHPRSVVSSAPESSPFGTKPRAPHSPTHLP